MVRGGGVFVRNPVNKGREKLADKGGEGTGGTWGEDGTRAKGVSRKKKQRFEVTRDPFATINPKKVSGKKKGGVGFPSRLPLSRSVMGGGEPGGDHEDERQREGVRVKKNLGRREEARG